MANVYASITDKIVASLKKGVRPWMQPWQNAYDGDVMRPVNHLGKPYSGINVFILWLTAMEKGYSAPMWMTYKRALEYGGHVRKGEHASAIVHAGAYSKIDENGEETTKFGVRTFFVFNVEQIDGLPEQFQPKVNKNPLTPNQRIKRAEEFFDNLKADVRHGGDKAFYSPSGDFIAMPNFETFVNAEAYYATRGHESAHWTMHPTRLNRNMQEKWLKDGYAMEELVAELASAYLAADLGIYLEPKEENVGYIDNWLGVLQNDPKAIFTAASYAEKAAKYLHSLQPGENSATGEDHSDEEDSDVKKVSTQNKRDQVKKAQKGHNIWKKRTKPARKSPSLATQAA